MNANSSISRASARGAALVMGDLAREEVELARVRLAQRVAVHHLVRVGRARASAVDADELVGRGGEREQIVRHRDHREAELALEIAQQRVEVLLRGQVEADRRLVEHSRRSLAQSACASITRRCSPPESAPTGRRRELGDADARERVVHRRAILAGAAAAGAEVREPPHQHDVEHARGEARAGSRDAAARSRSVAAARALGGRAAEHVDAARPRSARARASRAAASSCPRRSARHTPTKRAGRERRSGCPRARAPVRARRVTCSQRTTACGGVASRRRRSESAREGARVEAHQRRRSCRARDRVGSPFGSTTIAGTPSSSASTSRDARRELRLDQDRAAAAPRARASASAPSSRGVGSSRGACFDHASSSSP